MITGETRGVPYRVYNFVDEALEIIREVGPNKGKQIKQIVVSLPDIFGNGHQNLEERRLNTEQMVSARYP